jgi:uncharacterized protein HemX
MFELWSLMFAGYAGIRGSLIFAQALALPADPANEAARIYGLGFGPFLMLLCGGLFVAVYRLLTQQRKDQKEHEASLAAINKADNETRNQNVLKLMEMITAQTEARTAATEQMRAHTAAINSMAARVGELSSHQRS